MEWNRKSRVEIANQDIGTISFLPLAKGSRHFTRFVRFMADASTGYRPSPPPIWPPMLMTLTGSRGALKEST